MASRDSIRALISPLLEYSFDYAFMARTTVCQIMNYNLPVLGNEYFHFSFIKSDITMAVLLLA